MFNLGYNVKPGQTWKGASIRLSKNSINTDIDPNTSNWRS